jgi:hypothetical protein
MAKIAYQFNNFRLELPDSLNSLKLACFDGDIQYIKCLYQTEFYLDCIPLLEKLKSKYQLSEPQTNEVNGTIEYIKNNEKNRYRVL